MDLVDGAWLGVDVGQARSKVYNFCLIEIEAGSPKIWFEVGGWRPLVLGLDWPPGNAGVFEDLKRDSRLSLRAESCAIAILENAELVSRWMTIAGSPDRVAGACVDAPAGFARTGERGRDTEACAAQSFATEDEPSFVAAIERFSRARNDTPLRQRYYWKLVGQLALRFLAMAGGPRGSLASLQVVTARSAEGIATGKAMRPPARGASIQLPPSPPGRIRIREGFPSDVYARANGALGIPDPASRNLLGGLASRVSSRWEATGNARPVASHPARNRSSVPPSRRMVALSGQQTALLAALKGPGPLRPMKKVPGDPAWADLWDAFACAFSSCCEAHGCADLVGSDPRRLAVEGAILAPRMASGT